MGCSFSKTHTVTHRIDETRKNETEHYIKNSDNLHSQHWNRDFDADGNFKGNHNDPSNSGSTGPGNTNSNTKAQQQGYVSKHKSLDVDNVFRQIDAPQLKKGTVSHANPGSSHSRAPGIVAAKYRNKVYQDNQESAATVTATEHQPGVKRKLTLEKDDPLYCHLNVDPEEDHNVVKVGSKNDNLGTSSTRMDKSISVSRSPSRSPRGRLGSAVVPPTSSMNINIIGPSGGGQKSAPISPRAMQQSMSPRNSKALNTSGRSPRSNIRHQTMPSPGTSSRGLGSPISNRSPR